MIKNILCAFAALVVLAGCASDDHAVPQRFYEPRFNTTEPVRLKVNKVEVVSEFLSTYKRPNVEYLFPVSIEKTATLWANDNLKAADLSSDKQATFIIKDASVTEEVIKSSQLFEKDSLRYRAKLSVVLKVSDPYKFSSAETSLEAWRELTIPADTSIESKETYWKEMVDKLFEGFNTSMRASIAKHLNMYVENNTYVQEYNN